MLGEAIGRAVVVALDRKVKEQHSSEEMAKVLADWFSRTDPASVPWLKAQSRWQVLSAEILLERATSEHVKYVWPLLRRWTHPSDTIAARDDLMEIAGWIGRSQRADRLLDLATVLVDGSHSLDDADLETLVASREVPQALADLAILAVAMGEEDASEEPVIVTKGTLRSVARIVGDAVDRKNRLTDGRLAIARTIGYGTHSRNAHLALMEISNSVCRPVEPSCSDCPAATFCRTGNSTVPTIT
jgi:DNA (cytosine-5)-methyltransferase 1